MKYGKTKLINMLNIRNFLKTLKIEYIKIKNMSDEFDELTKKKVH